VASFWCSRLDLSIEKFIKYLLIDTSNEIVREINLNLEAFQMANLNWLIHDSDVLGYRFGLVVINLEVGHFS
jgi:hypothetical protein